MYNLFKKIHSGLKEPGMDGNLNQVTAKQLLGMESDNGYTSPQEFIKYCRSLREPEVKQLDQLFQSFKDGLRIIGSSTPNFDKGGRLYTFINFNKPKGTVGLKLILESGMDSLLNDYLDGKVSINFTLDELVEEALNA